jgi:hypothetical protein
MIELRDGEYVVWFRCCQRRDPVPSLALALASGHRCGSGGSPATSGGAGPLLPSKEVTPQEGHLRGISMSGVGSICLDTEKVVNLIESAKCSSQPGPAPSITVPTRVDNLAAPSRPRRQSK